MSSAQHILGPNGSFAAALPGYEVRAGQLEMTAAVERALAEERVLFCEAGTGTGKTLAYLVPAIASGKKVIISTATRALEEQIINKDIPLIERALGQRVSVAVMKGLRNYLCLRRFNEVRTQPSRGSAVSPLRLRLLEQWYRESDAGDFAELAGIPEGDPLLGLVSSSSETRVGSRCTYYEECFITRMKRAAEDARIVIVNHHLFFADLALRGPHPGRVLPNYDAVIFDEAHQVEDVATLFFGVRLGERQLASLAAEAGRVLQLATPLSATANNCAVRVEKTSTSLFESLRGLGLGSEARVRIERDVWSGRVYRDYLDLDAALDSLQSTATSVREALDPGDPEQLFDGLDGIARRAETSRQALATIVDGARGRVTWFEPEARASALSSSPIEISNILRERIFQQIPSVILTSATLTTPSRVAALSEPASEATDTGAAFDEVRNSPFAFERLRLGASELDRSVDELIVPSPFDYPASALLYVPKDLPDPKSEEFHPAMAARVHELIEASGGGAFVLTTSLRSLRLLHEGLKPMLGKYKLFIQGSAPKQALLSAFRSAEQAVLLATMGFWEGVDVPGRALRLVILEKIPFPAPNDPLIAARAELIERDGGNPFEQLFVPLAQMSLKQGFGRLIRTQEDRGVVALFDARIHRRGYGQRILSALPDARRTADLEATAAFLRRLTQ